MSWRSPLPILHTVVVQPHARKQLLQKLGRCFTYLRRGHISRECQFHKRCAKCNGRHHVSICQQGSKKACDTVPISARMAKVTHLLQLPPDLPVSQPCLDPKTPAFPFQSHCSINLWINSSRPILLWAARACAFNPASKERSRQLRIVLIVGANDCMSQKVARELALTSEGKKS